MSKFTFSLVLPSWLAQWYVNRCGGVSPLRMPKGSVESILVQRFTVRKSESISPDIPKPGDLVIEIPDNRAKPAAVYCCLPLKAKKMLEKSISDQFNLCMYEGIIRPCFPNMLKKDLIESWMEQNGIEFTEQNWLGVEKRFTRRRNAMLATMRVRKSRKKTSK